VRGQPSLLRHPEVSEVKLAFAFRRARWEPKNRAQPRGSRAPVGGLGVVIGSRVGALAEPGEILALATVKDLVVGSDVCFQQRGRRQPKDVPGSRRLYAVDQD
jgi:hypothetical protein